MIINPHYIPDLGLKFDRILTKDQLQYLSNPNPDIIANNYVYYTRLRHECGVAKLPSHLSQEIIKSIKERRILLVIDFDEARYAVVDEIYNHLIRKEGLPPDQILLIGSSPDLKNAIEICSRNLDVNPIKFEVFYVFEKIVKDFKDIPTIGTFQSKKVPRKAYINLNHFFRVHRAYVMLMLEKKNLLDYGYNSFHNAMDHGELDIFKRMYPDLLIPETRYLDIQDDKSKLSGELTRKFVTTKIDTLPYFINDSMVHIIGETQFFGGPRDLSEKAFKPIFFKQPFIFLGQYRCLELLRELGYKTFDGIIDETYDTITDHQLRLDMIVTEIEKLCVMTDEDKIKFLSDCADIVEHNYNLLLSKEIHRQTLL